MMFGLVLLGGILVTHLVTVLAFANNSAAAPHEWISAALSATVMLIPLAFIFAAIRRQLARAAISDLLVAIAPPATISDIQSALRHTLQDDHLTIRYWLPDSQTYVGADGRPIPAIVTWRYDRRQRGRPPRRATGRRIPDRAHQRHPALLNSAVAASAITLRERAPRGGFAAHLSRCEFAQSDRRSRPARTAKWNATCTMAPNNSCWRSGRARATRGPRRHVTVQSRPHQRTTWATARDPGGAKGPGSRVAPCDPQPGRARARP